MSEEWKKRDRPCEPCPDCGAELYEKFWGNGGWVRTDKATDGKHTADDCVRSLRSRLATAEKCAMLIKAIADNQTPMSRGGLRGFVETLLHAVSALPSVSPVDQKTTGKE